MFSYVGIFGYTQLYLEFEFHIDYSVYNSGSKGVLLLITIPVYTVGASIPSVLLYL